MEVDLERRREVKCANCCNLKKLKIVRTCSIYANLRKMQYLISDRADLLTYLLKKYNVRTYLQPSVLNKYCNVFSFTFN